jgi:hypothetical protein
MKIEHLGIVHFVDMITGEDQDVRRILSIT